MLQLHMQYLKVGSTSNVKGKVMQWGFCAVVVKINATKNQFGGHLIAPKTMQRT